MRLSIRILLSVIAGIIVTAAAAIPITVEIGEPAIRRTRVATISGLGPLLSRAVAADPTLLDRPDEIESLLAIPTAVVSRAELPSSVVKQLREGPVAAHGGRKLFTFFAIEHDARVVRVGPLPEPAFNVAMQVAAAFAVTMVVALIITFLLVRPILLRLRSLRTAAERLSQGDLDARADGGGQDALGSVARSFNEMGARVQTMVKGQRDLLQAVSHEFRTPASRIRFELELLRAKTDASEREEKIAAIEDSLGDLDLLVSELMEYVRYETGSPVLTRQEVAVASEAELAFERHSHLRDGIELESDVAAALVLPASLRHFRRVLDNLVSNAIRHAVKSVRIEAKRRGDSVILRVEDDGPGIDIADRERVLEPFARLDDSRSRNSGGTGLGLALVARIMNWHGGELRAVDSSLGGAAFECSWPVRLPS